MVVAVTGATGFIGSAVVTEALARDARVVALSRRMPREADVRTDWRTIDLFDLAALTNALRGVDAVVHAAGLAHVFDPWTGTDAFHRTNVLGTGAVARAALTAGVPKLIHLSSVSVYGSPEAGGTEDAVCRPSGPYATSKFEAEQEAARLARKTGTDLTILRLATVYGEGDRGNIARLIRAIARRRFVWIGRGLNRKSLIYKTDAARAIVQAVFASSHVSGIFNVSAEAVPMRRIVELIEAPLGRRAPAWHVPAAAARLTGRVAAIAGRPGLSETVERWLTEDVYPADRFNSMFGFEPRVDPGTGLQKEVQWYRGRLNRENLDPLDPI